MKQVNSQYTPQEKVFNTVGLLERAYGKRLTIKDMSSFFNVTPPVLASWLRGQNTPTTLKNISAIDRIFQHLHAVIVEGDEDGLYFNLEPKYLESDQNTVIRWHEEEERARLEEIKSTKAEKKNKKPIVKPKVTKDITARLENIERKLDLLLQAWKVEDK